MALSHAPDDLGDDLGDLPTFVKTHLPDYTCVYWEGYREGVEVFYHPRPSNVPPRLYTFPAHIPTGEGARMPHPFSREFVEWASNNERFLTRLPAQFAVWDALSPANQHAIREWDKITNMEARDGIPLFIPAR